MMKPLGRIIPDLEHGKVNEVITSAGRGTTTLIPDFVALPTMALALLRRINAEFPRFQYRMAFRARDVEKVEAALADIDGGATPESPQKAREDSE
ncbi:MAG: hypothetical protein WCJ64_06430 [Rhodospirillaceae bacterium]